MRLLIVEDEQDLCRTMAQVLRSDGYEVDACGDGGIALELATVESYDLILLDLNLPVMDGMEVLRRLRMENAEVKILILSARTELQDKVDGLDFGANDYLTKPFHFAELEARIRSLTRRRFVQEDTVLSCGGISFDTVSRTATADGRVLNLPRKEAGLLEYLLLHQGRVVSAEELMEHLWDGSVNSFSNAVRVHISALRKKLRSVLGYDPIQNKVGQGYTLAVGKEDGSR